MKAIHTFAILAYKESPHLQECIDSLKNQTTKSEIIICTSTPSTFLTNIATKNNLKLCINPERKGIASDWNFALSSATTDYVTLAHQDDIYFPNYSKEVLQLAETRKDTLIIFSNYDEVVINKNRTFVRKKSLNFFIKATMLKLFFRNKNSLTKNKQRLLALGDPIGCPTVTFQKNNLGDFKFDKNFSINMDWKAWADLAEKKGAFIWVKKTLVSHRIYAESTTSQGIADNRRQKEDLEMFQRFLPSTIAIIMSKLYGLSYKNNNNN